MKDICRYKGFTLIELMICIAVFGIITVSVYKIGTENLITHKNSEYRQQAIWVLQNQIEALRSLPFEQINDSTAAAIADVTKSNSNLREVSGGIGVETTSPGLKKMTASIGWRDARQNEQKLSLCLYRYRQ